MEVLVQIILLIVVAQALLLAVYAWRNRPALGAQTFSALMLMVALWTGGLLLATFDFPEPVRLLFCKISFIGVATVPVIGSILNLRFARVAVLTTPRAVSILLLEPIFSIILVWTYPASRLFWSDVEFAVGTSSIPYHILQGPMYWLHFIYCFTLVLISILMMNISSKKSREFLRVHVWLLSLATLLPFGARIIYVLFFSKTELPDLTPLFLSVSGMIFLFGFFRYKMLDLLPIAYDSIVQSMSDGLVLFDMSGRIVQVNHAAEKILGIVSKNVIGLTVEEVSANFPDIHALLHSRSTDLKEVLIRQGDRLMSYDFQVSRLPDPRGKNTGWMLLMHDTTATRERENTQKRRAEELEALHTILLDITISKDMDTLLETIVERAVSLLQAAGGSLYLSDPRAREVRCAASINNEYEQPNAVYPFGSGPGAIAANAKPFITSQPMRRGEQKGPAAMIGVPLSWQERVTGVIVVFDDKENRVFSPEDLGLLEMMARQATIVVENARLLQEERLQREQAETLREVTASISSSLELERVLDLILEQLARVVPYDSTSLMLIRNDELDIVAQRGFRDNQENFPHLKINQLGHAMNVISSKTPAIISDTRNDPRWIKWLESEYIMCWMGVPLVYQGEAIGFLNVDSEQPNFYTDSDAQLAEAFANQAVIAIENARLFESAARRAHEAETLRQATSVVAATLKQEEAIQRILDQLSTVIVYDSASIQLLEDDELVIVGGKGWTNGESVVGVRFPIPGDNPNTVVMQTRKPYVLTNAPTAYPTFRTSIHSHIKSWLGVPLIVHDRVIGMLALDGKQENNFSQEDVNLVTAFADQVAIAIENTRLYTESEQRASTLSRLYASAQDLTESLEPEVILEKLARNICQAIEATSAYILQVDRSAGTLQVVAEYFSNEACELERVSDLNQVYRLADYPVVVETFEKGTPINYSIDSTDRTPIEMQELHEYGVQSTLLVPVTLRGELIGELEIWESRHPRRFTEAEIQLATALSQHATAVLENARLYEREKVRVAELNALRATMTDISSELELPRLLESILQRSVAFLKASGGELGLVEEQSGGLRIVACHHMEEESTGLIIAPGEGAMGWVTQNHLPLVVPHYPSWEGRMERYANRNWSTVLAVPMMFRNRLLGVIGLVEKNPEREFRIDELRLLEMFAQQAVIAVQNATLYQEQRTTAEKRAILHHVSQEVVRTSLDPEGIYTSLHNAASQLMQSEAFAITVVDEARSMIDAVYLFDHKGRSKPLSFPKGRGLSGHVIQSGESVSIPDLLLDEEMNQGTIRVGDREDVRSIIAVPMRLGDKITGTLSAQSYQPNAYTAEDIRLLEMLASYAAIALENARLFQEVQKLAITDPLLGIYNRRHLFEIGQREFTRAMRFARPMAVIMYDIDDFKNINDSYGHAVGDQVLCELSRRVQDMIREIDTLGRFGGDEFVIILPETTCLAGEWVAERIRKKIADTPFYLDNESISITICLGVTEITPDSVNFEELVERADAAQYDSKQAGKNRVGTR